jgi:4-carboxymuconolactone decarboxylase
MSNSPRIQPLAEADFSDEARELLALPLKGIDLPEVSGFLATIVRHPGLYRRYAPFAGKLLVAGKLPARDRELAILRNAWLCKAGFEWGEHVEIAHKAGLSSAEIDGVTRGSGEAHWNPHERAVIKAVEELHAHGTISDATWHMLAQRYDDLQLIELPMLIGAYQMIAYVQNSLQVKLREGNAGLQAR